MNSKTSSLEQQKQSKWKVLSDNGRKTFIPKSFVKQDGSTMFVDQKSAWKEHHEDVWDRLKDEIILIIGQDNFLKLLQKQKIM